MARILTLTKNSDFQRLYKSGTAIALPLLVVYVGKNKEGYVRYGITVSTKIGNAVERNFCRRIIKSAFKGLAAEIKEGTDLVFVARVRTKTSGTNQVTKVMRAALLKAGVLK